MKKSKQIKSRVKNVIKFIVVPLMLLFLWIVLTSLFIINFDTSVSVLSYAHDKKNFNNLSSDKLLKEDKISGQFTAEENNLGIVSVRFQTFTRPLYREEDNVIFRIKEKGAKEWHYENKYRIGLIYDVPIFPFGFPIIVDAKGKTYVFEIESLKGEAHNSVAISNKDQILFSKYQISKEFILQNKQEAFRFAVKKFINSFETTDVRFSSFIYLLPLLFYLLLVSPFAHTPIEKLHSVKNSVVRFMRYFISYKLYWVIVAVVLLDVFAIQLTNDMVYLVIISLWIAILKSYQMESKISFVFALLLLGLSPFFLFLNNHTTAEKLTIWAFIFLVAGLMQLLMQLKRQK